MSETRERIIRHRAAFNQASNMFAQRAKQMAAVPYDRCVPVSEEQPPHARGLCLTAPSQAGVAHRAALIGASLASYNELPREPES